MAVAEHRFRVMASDAHVLVWGGSAYDTDFAEARLHRLESLWSRFRATSEVCELNHQQGHRARVSLETCQLVRRMCDGWRLTDGLYDPTTLPVLVDNGYRASITAPFDETDLPPECDGTAGGMGEVMVDETALTVTLPQGVCIDPGGIGKGLAAELVADELTSDGARGALVNIGGDIATSGEAPHGLGWTVSVEDPIDRNSELARFSIASGAVATSSTLSRRFGRGEDATHHIVDPLEGRISRTPLAAVTTVADSAWRAEVAAKALLIHRADPIDAARRLGVEAFATYLDGRTVCTDGVAERLTTSEGRAA